MGNIKKQFAEIKSTWGRAYNNALSNPTAWKPHLPNTELVVLDEAVEMVSTWIARSRAPNGFSPGYHLAKSLAVVHLPSLLSAAQQLEAGSYNHFPNFVSNLTNTLSAIHTMAVYTPKNDQESLNADFSAELSQALSLLNTAQKELAKKSKILEASSLLAGEIEVSHGKVKEIEEIVELASQSIEESKINTASALENANECLEVINEKKEEFLTDIAGQKKNYESLVDEHQEEYLDLTADHKKSYESLISQHEKKYSILLNAHNAEYQVILKNNKTLNESLIEMTGNLKELQERSKKQEKIIDSILPRGASAGLASAFSSRCNQLDVTKWVWLLVFVCSLLALSAFAWHIIGIKTPEGTTFWNQLLVRLPLAAPLIWLGWFSAIQYGNVIRVQEDYAFKEATSKAFQGYKDHMEHLGNVDLDEGRTALTLLSETTIQVLGREPLRIYGKTEQDASPTYSLAQLLKKREKKSESKPDGEATKNG